VLVLMRQEWTARTERRQRDEGGLERQLDHDLPKMATFQTPLKFGFIYNFITSISKECVGLGI
jgi:hypothetical protein